MTCAKRLSHVHVHIPCSTVYSLHSTEQDSGGQSAACLRRVPESLEESSPRATCQNTALQSALASADGGFKAAGKWNSDSGGGALQGEGDASTCVAALWPTCAAILRIEARRASHGDTTSSVADLSPSSAPSSPGSTIAGGAAAVYAGRDLTARIVSSSTRGRLLGGLLEFEHGMGFSASKRSLSRFEGLMAGVSGPSGPQVWHKWNVSENGRHLPPTNTCVSMTSKLSRENRAKHT